MSETCKTCKHFNTDKPNEDEGYHECLESFGINAGIRSHNLMDIQIVYRETHQDSWCYKHDRRPGLADASNQLGAEGETQ